MIATLLALTQLFATGDPSEVLRDLPRTNSSESEHLPLNIKVTDEWLTGHLEAADAVALDGDSVEVKFILMNWGPKPVHLAERWNSWGTQQWWFTVKDANNKTYELRNPQSDWWRNFLTLFEIKPNESYELRCRLTVSGANSIGNSTPDGSALFCATLRSAVSPLRAVPYAEKVYKWTFPLTIIGHFDAKLVSAGISSDWEGAIETRPLIVASDQSSNQSLQLTADRPVTTLEFYETVFDVNKARFRQR
jgi:hypothetical protein